jgi:hypothetical protein
MQTIIDFLGSRVVAVPLLPVGRGTLVYGSSVAGKTLLNEVPEVLELLNSAGEELFLGEHIVLDKRFDQLEIWKFTKASFWNHIF